MSRIQGKTASPQFATGQVYVGIDVSKSRLDVYLHPAGVSQSVTNDKAGLQKLARLLLPHQPELIVLEATGCYHRRAHRHLHGAGFHVAVMNPFRTRKFADMLGQLAKTDAIDAKSLALFAAMVRPEAKAPPAPAQADLAALLVARRQITLAKGALLNQLSVTEHSLIRQQLRARIKMAERHLAALDAEIRQLLRREPDLKHRFDILTSIPGIGRWWVSLNILFRAACRVRASWAQAHSRPPAQLDQIHPTSDPSGQRPIAGVTLSVW